MKHKIKYARILLRLLYEYIFVIMATIFIKVIFKSGAPGFWECACILLCFLLSYAAREWINIIAVIPVIHILMGVLLWILPFSKGMTGISIVIVIYLMSASISYAVNGSVLKPASDIPWPTFMVGFIVYIYGLVLSNNLLLYTAYIAPAILIVLHFIIIYMEGLKKYITRVQNVSGLPVSRMIHVNTVIVMFILLILISVLFLVSTFNADAAWPKLYDALTSIVIIISQIVKIIAALISGLLSGSIDRNDEYIAEAKSEISRTVFYISDAMEILLKLVLVACVIYAAYRLTRYIIRKLSVKRYYAEDIIEEAEKPRQDQVEKRKKAKGFAIVTLEDKARRYYRLRILRYRKDIQLDEYKTSHDIEQQINEQGLSDVSEITTAYNELRYGDMKIDKAMVNKMKILSRRNADGAK